MGLDINAKREILLGMIDNLERRGYMEAMEAVQKRAQAEIAASPFKEALLEQVSQHEQLSRQAQAGAEALWKELEKLGESSKG